MPEISRSKVHRLIEKYNLSGIGSELEARWTGDHPEGEMSLRELADFFNKRLIESALVTSGQEALEPELNEIYRYLTSDEVTRGQREDKRNELRDHGIDVDDLKADFVTYQAIRSYLKDWREVERPDISDAEKLESDATTINKMASQTEAVTDSILSNLRNTDRVSIGEFDVGVSVEMTCAECGRRTSAVEIIEHGGCQCLVDDETT
jgi:hypothetical protein